MHPDALVTTATIAEPQTARWGRWLASMKFIFTVVILMLVTGTPALGQTEENAVYVDDSPRAWELFLRAEEQRKDNPGETTRLLQELLDRYALKLIPRSTTDADHLVSVRRRVNTMLQANAALLERYRAMETPEAERMLAAGEDERLRRTRFLTAPALDATLRLAQRAYEEARFRTAFQLLLDAEEHPDLDGDRAVHRWFMLGICANHLEQTTWRGRARQALANTNSPLGQRAHEQLMALLQAGPGPEMTRGLTPLDIGPAPVITSIVDHPIWSVDLDDSLLTRRFESGNRSRGRDSPGMVAARMTGEWLTALPTVVENSIYINEGQTIRALDRYSVRERWRKQIGDSRILNVRGNNTVTDLNGVAVHGNRLVTVTGHGSLNTRLGTGRVVCLDRTNGDVLWEVALHRVLDDPEHEGLYPLGVPLIHDGTVYIAARKLTKQVLTSLYVIALDLDDKIAREADRVRWVRYVASSASIQAGSDQAAPYLVPDEGRLFVASPLGAVASLDMMSGETHWLRRIETPFQPGMTLEPWEMTAPAICELGVVALSPDRRTIHFLNRETGSELFRVDAQNWHSPNYLLARGSMIYAIGSDVAGVHVEQTNAPIWRLNAGLNPEEYYEPRGRVQLAHDTLIVPSNAGVLFVDGETGQIDTRVSVEGASNPLSVGPELYVATSDELKAYMPLAVAERMLREQIESSPFDPDPILSLLRLAARADDAERSIDLAIDASVHAVEVLDRLGEGSARRQAQEELFSTMLRIAGRSTRVPFARAASLHDRLASIVSGQEQRVQQLMARGDWLAATAVERDPALLSQAIETYQQLLEDDELASTIQPIEDVRRRTRDIAMDRLAWLISIHGQEVYAPFSERATKSLASVVERQDAAEAHVAIARSYPFAPAGWAAAERGVALLIEAGEVRRALDVLEHQYRASITIDQKQRSIGAIVSLALAQQWMNIAEHWLDVASRERGVDALVVDGSLSPLREIESRLSSAASPGRDARVGHINAENGTTLPAITGYLLPAAPSLDTYPTTFALLAQSDALSRVDLPNLEETWKSPLLDDDVELIAFNEDRLVIRYPDAAGTVVVLDARTGEQIWGSGSLEESLINARNTVPRNRQIEVRGQRRLASPFESIVFGTTHQLTAVGRSGGLARYSYDKPNAEPVWRTDHPLTVVHYAAMHELAIVLAGMIGDTDEESTQQATIALMDPATGESIRTFEPLGTGLVRWLRVAPGGLAVFATDTSVEAVDLSSGELAWANTSSTASWASRAWIFGPWAILADRSAETAGIRLEDGAVRDVFQPQSELTWQPNSLIDVYTQDGDAVLHYRERVTWFDREGQLIADDSISSNRDYTNVLFGDALVFVISHINRPRRFGNNRSNERFLNRIYTLSKGAKNLDETDIPTDHQSIRGAVLLDGWLLLSETSRTITIPLERSSE